MNNKYKKIIYYFIIFILFFITDKVIYYFNYDNNILNYTLESNNMYLKDEISNLSNISYDFDYEIGYITYNSLYNSDTYYIKSNINTNNNLVLNNEGLLGILNDNKLILTKYLTMSVIINESVGILKNNEIEITNNNYNIGDKIYSYNLSNINEKYLIGYIKDIDTYSLNTIIKIDYIPIDSRYVVIIK